MNKNFRGARDSHFPFKTSQQFSKTPFSGVTRLCRADYFAENPFSKTSAKGGFAEIEVPIP